MPSPKWHYFMHSTDSQNVLKILKAGKINKSGKIYSENGSEKGSEAEHYCYKAVYCHYIFNDLPFYKEIIWNYEWLNLIIVLDPSIAKDLEMHVCNSLFYGNCMKDKEELLMHAKGNLKKMPPLEKIRTWITSAINYVKTDLIKDKSISTEEKMKYLSRSYIDWHECLFPAIPIQYIRAIIVPNIRIKTKYILPKSHAEKIQEYITSHNLPIKVISVELDLNSNTVPDFHDIFEQI